WIIIARKIMGFILLNSCKGFLSNSFKLKLHNYAFSEQKMDTFAPNYLIVESNIWSSKLWVLQENPLDKSSIIKKKPKVEISISLYKANQIYRFIKQLISDEELKRYEDYCCTAGSFFGELTNTSMGSHNFSDSFPCGLFERDFDKELFKMIESELQEARVKSNRISFFERFR
ncbi:MAG: hypothetical protein AAFY45_20240, partial [Bacteroidota bacterium]